MLVFDQGFFISVRASQPNTDDITCSPLSAAKSSESFVQHRKSILSDKLGLSSAMFWEIPQVSGGSGHCCSLSHVLAGSLAFLIASGLGYLFWLWRQRGLLSHMRISLQEPKSMSGAVALLTYLVLLVTLDLTIKREAERGGGHYATSPFLLVAAVELGKLIVTSTLHVRATLGSTSLSDEAGEHELDGVAVKATAHRVDAIQIALHMFPVALIFNVNNVLNLLVLSLVRLDAYAVWRNISILFNAIIWVWVLHKRLEVHRWVAITTCALGCSFNSLTPDGRWDFDTAVVGVLLTAFLSSLASVLNEKVIKSPAASNFTLDQLNLILYSETLGLMLMGLGSYYLAFRAQLHLSVSGLLSTFTVGAWKIIVVQIALGLSVSRVLKYADAVAKTVVGSLRDVVIVFLAPTLVSATRFDLLSVGSACLVGLAGMIYFAPTVEPALEVTGGGDCARDAALIAESTRTARCPRDT